MKKKNAKSMTPPAESEQNKFVKSSDSKPFYKKKWFIIVVVLFIIGGVAGSMQGGSDGKDPSIIWKDADKIGILNFEIDGTHVKEHIVNDFFIQSADYLSDLDKDSLDTEKYEYIQCVGNVVGEDGKIQCTIKGKLSTEYIKSEDELMTVYIEDNMEDLFIPKALQ